MTIEKSSKLIGLVAQLKSLYKPDKGYAKSGKWFYFTSLDENYYLDEHIKNYKLTSSQKEFSNKLYTNEGILIISYQPEDIVSYSVYPIVYSVISFVRVLESDINIKQKRRALDDFEIRMLNICKLIECIYDGTDDYIEQENKDLDEMIVSNKSKILLDITKKSTKSSNPNKKEEVLIPTEYKHPLEQSDENPEKEEPLILQGHRPLDRGINETLSPDTLKTDEEEELDIADSLDAKEAIRFIKSTESLFKKINSLYSKYCKNNSVVAIKTVKYKIVPFFDKDE